MHVNEELGNLKKGTVMFYYKALRNICLEGLRITMKIVSQDSRDFNPGAPKCEPLPW
jgi:hypothetical protein